MVEVTQQQVAEPELQWHLLAPEQAPCAQELQGRVARLSHLMTTSLRDPLCCLGNKRRRHLCPTAPDDDSSASLRPQHPLLNPHSQLITLHPNSLTKGQSEGNLAAPSPFQQ